MSRLFVALRPPRPLRAQLCALMAGVPGARWQNDAQLHLTVRYIGEVDAAAVNDIAAALAEIRVQPIEARLAGVGAFARRERVHTLWAGVAPQEPICRLQREVDRVLAPFGLEFEHRAFVPHIPVARLALGADAALETARWQSCHATLASMPFFFTHVSLYESHVHADGAQYREVRSARCRLSPQSCPQSCPQS